ncbi:sensor histidine kinase [Chondrinema litorale]|uniref:sensor histidine kinase n=1 Tax=Chondrinema litorale TaxID=2994555 RepID=UPI00254399DF|nr:sensor histidine kinase [Chondrinema litorale]UZR98864.1 sensor histidine kinase [Chondrinema litorale]
MKFDIKDKKNQQYLMITLHILVWGIIISLPFFSAYRSPKNFSEFLREMRPPFFFACIFYINYFYLIKKFLFNKQIWKFLLVNFVLFTVAIFTMEMLSDFVRDAAAVTESAQKRPRPSFIEIFISLFIAFGMITGVSVAIKITSEWFRTEDLRKELEKEHLKSELLNLKNQLNPHFFFNTLNNIYGLIIQDQDRAQDAVHQLSKLMRYLLYDSNEKFVPLTKEIDFMHHYIDLMRLRLMTTVAVEYRFPKVTSNASIAPLLCISLIENAFKHGVHSSEPSEIFMEMNINSEKELTFHIKNTSFPKSDTDRSGSGIGLENLKKRLNLLYPQAHQLSIEDGEKYFDCTLTLQL